MLGQLFRMPQIVGIEKRYEPSARFPDAGIPCARQATIDLRENAHAPIGDKRRDLAASVRAAVVHDDDFEVCKGLRQHRSQRLRDVPLGIVERHDHRNSRTMGIGCHCVRTIGIGR